MSFLNWFKRKKKMKKYKAVTPLVNEGINALFIFLDEVLPDYEDKDFHTVTPQIFVILYIIGMSKTWGRISGLSYKYQIMIAFVVTGGIYDRYKIELRDWGNFINEFDNPEKINKFLEQEFVEKRIKQGEDHFFYFLTLKHIPHNPLDILLKEWTKIKFYHDNEPYEKGEIDGYFSKEEYSFINRIIMYELFEVNENYESAYKQGLHVIENYPFDRSKYYLDT